MSGIMDCCERLDALFLGVSPLVVLSFFFNMLGIFSSGEGGTRTSFLASAGGDLSAITDGLRGRGVISAITDGLRGRGVIITMGA
jgi:hypothetical protein